MGVWDGFSLYFEACLVLKVVSKLSGELAASQFSLVTRLCVCFLKISFPDYFQTHYFLEPAEARPQFLALFLFQRFFLELGKYPII